VTPVSGIVPHAPFVELPPQVGEEEAEEDVHVELLPQDDDTYVFVDWTEELGREALEVVFPLPFPDDVGLPVEEVVFSPAFPDDEAE
jgi:hypothetical protein